MRSDQCDQERCGLGLQLQACTVDTKTVLDDLRRTWWNHYAVGSGAQVRGKRGVQREVTRTDEAAASRAPLLSWSYTCTYAHMSRICSFTRGACASLSGRVKML